jgi:bacterial/archaeal transporter family-2 protein
METLLLVLLGLAAGSGIPVQASLNSALRQHLGRPEWATLVNFGVGFVAMAAVLLVQRVALPTAAQVARAPWWTWTGGALGAFFVFSTVVLTPRLGVATSLALILAGQLLSALLLDHVGALGLATREVTPGRLAGVVLLAAGVFLVQR